MSRSEMAAIEGTGKPWRGGKEMYTKKQKILAAFICAVFILVTFFSVFFIVKEADHDCTGEGCPICACIHQAEETLKQLGTGTVGASDFQPAVAMFALALVCAFLFVPYTSLVSQKVRLND